MKYVVKMCVADIGSVRVEADNAQEAKEKAEQAYESGQIFWQGSEITSIEVSEERVQPREHAFAVKNNRFDR